MKIAHVNMFYWPTFGGVEQVMQELAERQVKQGHEVHVFCCNSDKYKKIKKKEEIHNGVIIHRIPYLFRLSLSTFIWPSLLWSLPKHKFDIYHTHVSGHAYVLFTSLISLFTKIPHIHTTHCPWTTGFRSWKIKIPLFFTYLIFNRLAFLGCKKITVLSPWEINAYLRKWTSEDKIVKIPNGMDNIFYKKITPNNFKKKHKIKGKIILFFGRLNLTKGPDMLARVAVSLVKKRKDINFVFLGPDEGAKEIVAKIIKNSPRIYLFSPIRNKKEIAEMYQAADIYVLPSYREGLPLTLFEAYASGLPIIASPVNGIPYEMKEPENGYFVKYADLKALEEKIIFLLDKPSLRKKIAAENKKKAKNHTWDLILKQYMRVYKEILKS